MDLNVNRSMTLCPQQFENIKPSVSITMKDIPAAKSGELYKNIDTLANNLFKLEFLNQYVIFKDIKEKGFDKYSQDLVDDIDTLIKELNESIDNISVELGSYEKF